MPNESWNKLIVYGPRSEVEHFRAHARDLNGPDADARLLDLDRLRPDADDPQAQKFENKLGELYWDPKWNAWDVNVTRLRVLASGAARLEYSFITAWSEPIGPVAYTSQSYPNLWFVLAGVEVGNAAFTTSLIHRGRVRHWEMPERVWAKHADYEEFEGEEGKFLAGYQPRIMAELIAHWERKLESEASKAAAREGHQSLKRRVPKRRVSRMRSA
jgi:hypothetical protein